MMKMVSTCSIVTMLRMKTSEKMSQSRTSGFQTGGQLDMHRDAVHQWRLWEVVCLCAAQMAP